jgi:formylglycine-generating enzyme required for sulfatase activity
MAMGLAAGCQFIGGIDSRSLGSGDDAAGDVGVDARADVDAMASNVDAGDAVSQVDGADSGSADASTDGGDAGVAGDAADTGSSPEASTGCPSGAGPVMIDAGGICVDSTEVTVGQYAAFLAAVDGGATVEVSPSCPSGASFVPGGAGGGDWPQSPDTLPVDDVTWCDAWSFCKWAGKRLCGAIGGGAFTSAPTNGANPAISQWYAACSRAGSNLYPYGSTYEPSSCNGAGSGLTNVGSLSSCVGGYAGIFDMSGNVSEWEDNCDDAGANANCYLRGGSYQATGKGHPEWLECSSMTEYIPRSSPPYSDVGFRCCAP